MSDHLIHLIHIHVGSVATVASHTLIKSSKTLICSCILTVLIHFHIISAVFIERYLLLSTNIDSSTASDVRLRSAILVLNEAGIRQRVQRPTVLVEVLRLWHQRLGPRIATKSLNATWATSLMTRFSCFHLIKCLIIKLLISTRTNTICHEVLQHVIWRCPSAFFLFLARGDALS